MTITQPAPGPSSGSSAYPVGAVPRSPSVVDHVNTVGAELDQLAGAIAALEDRLAEGLAPTGEPGRVVEAETASARSPLGHQVAAHARQVRDLTARIAHLTERVDL